MAAKKERKKPVVEIEFTPGYEQRFTRAILKIYEKREREAMEAERKARADDIDVIGQGDPQHMRLIRNGIHCGNVIGTGSSAHLLDCYMVHIPPNHGAVAPFYLFGKPFQDSGYGRIAVKAPVLSALA